MSQPLLESLLPSSESVRPPSQHQTPSSSISLSPSVQADLGELGDLVFPSGSDSSAAGSPSLGSLHLDGGADAESGDEAEDANEENEGVKRWVLNEPRKPRKTSERKRADVAAFEQWIENNQANLDKDSGRMVNEAYQSASAIVKGFENRKIITSPRDYQLELFERAKECNTIAVLDTGKFQPLTRPWPIHTSKRLSRSWKDSHCCTATPLDH